MALKHYRIDLLISHVAYDESRQTLKHTELTPSVTDFRMVLTAGNLTFYQFSPLNLDKENHYPLLYSYSYLSEQVQLYQHLISYMRHEVYSNQLDLEILAIANLYNRSCDLPFSTYYSLQHEFLKLLVSSEDPVFKFHIMSLLELVCRYWDYPVCCDI